MSEQANLQSDAQTHGLQHHFVDLGQQHEASTLGMWTFLVTEVMFFGGLFLAYILFRIWYPDAWGVASRMLDWKLGGINTLLLLCSSLTMAMAVSAAQNGERKKIVWFLIITMILGTGFLGIKAHEYLHKVHEGLIPGLNFTYPGLGGKEEAFFFMYFVMTGVHALHMIIGIVIVGVIARMAAKGRFTKTYYNPVEVIGLYWHFVDIIWIFLYPLLYLVQLHAH